MKNLNWLVVLIMTGLIFNSCLDDEPTAEVEYKYAPVDSVHIGEIRPARMVTEITTFFTRQSDCEVFFDYDYQIAGNERTVSIISSNLVNQNCIEIMEVESNKLQFRPETSGKYVFRFWAGNASNNEPIFIIKEIDIP